MCYTFEIINTDITNIVYISEKNGERLERTRKIKRRLKQYNTGITPFDKVVRCVCVDDVIVSIGKFRSCLKFHVHVTNIVQTYTFSRQILRKVLPMAIKKNGNERIKQRTN